MATILVTGGTGFAGSLIIKALLKQSGVKKVISLSRRWDDSERLARETGSDKLRTINADIRDRGALLSAMRGVDYVIHAAAYKSVPSGEYNPLEITGVNIDGTVNVVSAAIERGVKKVLFISSDKACAPYNLYGKTKAVGESVAVSMNNMGKTAISVARYGNVLGSTGSVFPLFAQQAQMHGMIFVTNFDMTRFWFWPDDAVRFVISCLGSMIGGEIFVPILKSATMDDVAGAVSRRHGKCEIRVIGSRPGEKIHEQMISADEAPYVFLRGTTYLIAPSSTPWDRDWLAKIARLGYRNAMIPSGFNSFMAERIKGDELDKMAEVFARP